MNGKKIIKIELSIDHEPYNHIKSASFPSWSKNFTTHYTTTTTITNTEHSVAEHCVSNPRLVRDPQLVKGVLSKTTVS